MGHNQTKRSSEKLQKIQNFVFKFFTFIRLNNETEKEYLLSQGTDAKKLFIIPLVISQKIFKLENKSGRKDIVYLGNVNQKKNLKTILKTLNEVRKIKSDIKLNIIGKIMDDNVPETIKELGLEKSVVFHGYMTQDQKMTDLLNSISISVNSSTDEGQCLSVFDTALCGCALCLPKIMSFVDVFKGKALFHEVFDYQQLAKNILFYLDNPDIIEKHNKECVEMIKKEYSKETIEEKLRLLLSKLK
jgi:glycosyltransferase involved in cell wall biosynthesis